MKAELRDLSEVRKSLVVEISTMEVDAGIERLSQHYRRSLKVPGFRPGKAPAKLVRLRLRDQILQEVVQDLIPKAVDEAIREHGLEPVDTPAIRDVNIEEGHPLTFTATLETLPTVDPGEYQSLTLRRPPVDVTDESVAAELERLRERAVRFEAVEGRDVAQGDTVTVDLERSVIKPALAAESSEPGETEPHENIEIEIGGSANPPGFDEQLLGLSVGASRDFTLTYPEDHENTGLAGSEVAYTVAIKVIREKVLSSLDDEIARDLGSFDTLAALTDQVKADLVRQAELDADGQVRSELLRQLAGRVEGEVPEALIAREVDRRVERFVEHLINQRVDPRRANIDWGRIPERTARSFNRHCAEPDRDRRNRSQRSVDGRGRGTRSGSGAPGRTRRAHRVCRQGALGKRRGHRSAQGRYETRKGHRLRLDPGNDRDGVAAFPPDIRVVSPTTYIRKRVTVHA